MSSSPLVSVEQYPPERLITAIREGFAWDALHKVRALYAQCSPEPHSHCGWCDAISQVQLILTHYTKPIGGQHE